MATLKLGFKAFDAHELLCHFVAVAAGLYTRYGLRVELEDITFMPETELPVEWFQASCGAALASAVKGIPQRVVSVAVDRPMFWIYARPEITQLEGLAGQRLATFPAVAPPHHLANIVLSRAGLVDSAAMTLHPARDDVARLGLLKNGYVDAAVISSSIAPAKVCGFGMNELCLIGDEIRLPTTGLAIDQAFLDREPDLTRTLVDIHRRALALIHGDPSLVGRVLEDIFDVAKEHSVATARLYQGCFTQNGSTSAEIAQSAVDALSKSLSVETPLSWEKVYRF